jgi:hypothetical protein
MIAAIRMRQLVDWGAAVWAGILSGTFYLAVAIVLPWLALGDPWVHLRLIGSLVFGPAVVPRPETTDPLVLLVAVAITYALTIPFSALVALVVHQWGWVLSALGGAALGWGLYLFSFWTLSFFFPWIFPLRNWMLLLAFLGFGALVGALYELLEVEEYAPVETLDA